MAALQKASGLEAVEMPTVRKTSGPVNMNLQLPRQAVVLYQLTW